MLHCLVDKQFNSLPRKHEDTHEVSLTRDLETA